MFLQLAVRNPLPGRADYEIIIGMTAATHQVTSKYRSPSPSLLKLLLKTSLLTLAFLFLFLLITLLAAFAFGFSQYQLFLSHANTTSAQLSSNVIAALSTKPETDQSHINILILGTDSLAQRGDVPPLTDTMILLSLDTASGAISSISFPRDLWNKEYQTKINSLYAYGFERYPDQPEQFPTEVISATTGLPIHTTLVVSLAELAELINLIGGVRVEVPETFTDTEFPRTDVNIATETDPAKLYETVTFSAGEQDFDGETTLKYIRSRHAEGDQGSDLARSKRQQQIILAMMEKITSSTVLRNPRLMGDLYRYYQENFASSLPISQAMAIAKQLFPVRNALTISSIPLPVYPDDESGVITHPPIQQYNNQWVYIIRDAEVFKKYVTMKIYAQEI